MILLILSLHLFTQVNAAFSLLNGYDINCPAVSQWSKRVRICRNESHYNCLWNDIQLQYNEYCGYEEISRQGHKYVLMPNPQQVPCSARFYQPTTFTSKENSRCILKKSECSGEGQVVASNGNADSDRSCRCDYTRNFVFVDQPDNGCSCIPSQHDCSCYYRPCTNDNEVLHRDYKCRKRHKVILPESIQCDDIEKETSIISTHYDGELFISKIDKHNTIKRASTAIPQTFVMIYILVLAILMASLMGLGIPMVYISNVTSAIDVIVKEDGNKYRIIKGDSITVSYKVHSWFPVTSLLWQSRNKGTIHHIDPSRHNDTFLPTGTETQTLTINRFTHNDEGQYRFIVTNCIGLSNATIYSVPDLIENFNPMCRLMQNIRSLLNYDADFTTFEILEYGEPLAEHICLIDNDVTINYGARFDHKETDTIKWIRINEHATILEPNKEPEKYNGGKPEEQFLKIYKFCLSDSGDYVGITINSKGKKIDICYAARVLSERQFIMEEPLEKVIEYVKKEIIDLSKSRTDIREDLKYLLFQRLKDESLQESELAIKLCFLIITFWLKWKYGQYFNLILLMESLTKNGKNLKVFNRSECRPNVLLRIGLLASAKGEYLKHQEPTFAFLLGMFKKTLQNKNNNFVDYLDRIYDGKGNTFFHYLVLFGTIEATIILNICYIWLDEKDRAILNKTNHLKQTPLQLSAYLGKWLLFYTFFVNTKSVTWHKDKIQELAILGLQTFLSKEMEDISDENCTKENDFSQTKEDLHIVMNNIETAINKSTQANLLVLIKRLFPKKNITFNITATFGFEVTDWLTHSNKDEYLNFIKYLNKKELDKDVMEKELKDELVKWKVYRDLLIN